MPWQLTRNEVKNIFTKAVLTVADINNPNDDTFEEFTFKFFQNFHKIVFLTNLKLEMNSTVKGTEDDKYCFDITLNESMIDIWENFGKCIDYAYGHQRALDIKNKVNKFK